MTFWDDDACCISQFWINHFEITPGNEQNLKNKYMILNIMKGAEQ